MATIKLTATENITGCRKEVYAEMELDTETTRADIQTFVNDIIDHSDSDYIKLEFRADDDYSDIMRVPVRIPTEKDSDNGCGPIVTVMDQSNVDRLFELTVGVIIRSIEAVAYENQYNDDEDTAAQFFELRDRIIDEAI